ncbi:MAG: hypothetical protein VX768_20390 [Planctomycetota bacterium]|nr:hypothetical protein [Planctomycetota bacterium]
MTQKGSAFIQVVEMSTDPIPSNQPPRGAPSNFVLLYRLFRKHLSLMLLPVGLFSAAAATYILTNEPSWKGTQSLQIRDELAFQSVMPGRFDSLDMMKMVQETIHDTVRRQSVVTRVLKSIDPPEDYEQPAEWPTVEDIESLQESIALTPPNGAEFGRTEVLLLSVKARTAARAQLIVGWLAAELQTQLNALRDQRAQSIEDELQESVKLNRFECDSAIGELARFEKGLGDILIDLRSIASDIGAGGSEIPGRLNQIDAEFREARQKHEVLSRQLLDIRGASEKPDQVQSFSSELLAAQPVLQKLKEQLITLQSATARTLGQFESFHPKGKAALEAENQVKQKIRDEIRVAAKGLETQIASIADQMKRLEQSQEDLNSKKPRLAEVRTPYAELVKQVEQKRTVLNRSLEELARAKASRAAANSTNLITLIDLPYSGSRPEGVSKKIIIGAAGLTGLLSGIGLVFFAASPGFLGGLDLDEPVMKAGSGENWRTEALARVPAAGSGNTSERTGESSDDLPITKVVFPSDATGKILEKDDFEKESSPPEKTELEAQSEGNRSGKDVKTPEPAKVEAADVRPEPAGRRVEPFKLEPRKRKTAPEAHAESSADFEGTDSEILDTLEADPELKRGEATESFDEAESRLHEEHRRRIEKMFEDRDPEN